MDENSAIVPEMSKPVTSRILSTPILLCSLGFGMLTFLLPIYSRSLQASALAIGGLFSIFSATTMIARPLVGWGIDRVGRKLFLIIALAGYGAAMFIMAFSDRLSLLYLGRVMQGLASSFMWITAYTIAADLALAGERARSVARVDAAVAQGGLYGSIPGFALMFMLPLRSAWQILFIIFGICALIGVYTAWRRIPETKPSLPGRQHPKTSLPSGLIRLMVIVFITGTGSAMIAPIWLIYLQDKFNVESYTVAQAYLPAALVYGFLPVHLGWVSDRLGRAPLMALGLLVSGLVSLFIPGLRTVVLLALLWAIEALGFVMATPAEEAFVADLTGHEMHGMGYGLYTFASGMGMTLGPLIGGWFYDSMGHAVPFYATGTVLIIGALLIWVLLRNFK